MCMIASLCLPLLVVAVAVDPNTAVAVAPNTRGSSCEAFSCNDAEDDGMLSLLSIKSQALPARRRAELAQGTPGLAAMDAESQFKRLEAAKPIAWLHIPKAGSSLNNFMIHLPGVCPGVPEGLVISAETMGMSHNRVFKDLFHPLDETGACPGSFWHWGNHSGAGPFWEDRYDGHAFVMLRQPEQRVLSGYHFFQHSWPEEKPASNELEYAKRMQGCTVRMITRGGNTPRETCGGRDTGLPTWDEVALAVQRIRTGCAFVGITDQWPLSMCLGHRMFGGKCRRSDFVDGRITTGSQPIAKIRSKVHLYDLTPLGNFKDPYDGAVYQAALEVFQDKLLQFNVSMESCQPCFKEAGVEFDA